MNAISCAESRLALGVYVLGALEPVERVALEQHLETCPACRDELSELAGLPGLLAHVDVADVVGEEPSAPAELLERLLAIAAEERRGARHWRVMTAAAVIAIASAGAAAAAVQISESHHRTPASPTQIARTGSNGQVTARITTLAKAWGTAVRMQLTGVHEGETCSLVIVSRTGEREVAASWRVNYTGVVDVQGATAIPASDIASYDVMTLDGRRLVSVSA
jgi:hypothetical protein